MRACCDAVNVDITIQRAMTILQDIRKTGYQSNPKRPEARTKSNHPPESDQIPDPCPSTRSCHERLTLHNGCQECCLYNSFVSLKTCLILAVYFSATYNDSAFCPLRPHRHLHRLISARRLRLHHFRWRPSLSLSSRIWISTGS